MSLAKGIILGHHTIPMIVTIAAIITAQEMALIPAASMSVSLATRHHVYYTHRGRSGKAMLGKAIDDDSGSTNGGETS
jgi:hypothetical protein